MQRLLAFIGCLLISLSGYALNFETATTESHTYYLSNDGDDTNDGRSESSPWRTIGKINEALANDTNGGWIAPGDKVLFRRGDTFYGNLYVNRSGNEEAPIELSSYGDENDDFPIISGSGGTITGGDYFQAISMVNSSHVLVTKIWVKNDRKDGSRYTYGEYQSFGIKVIANKWGGIVRNITFREVKVSDVFGITIPPPSEFNALNATGIRFEGEAFEADKAVAIEDVLIEDCYFTHLGKAGVWAVHKGSKNPDDDSFNKNQNFIIRNNHFFKTGGSGVILSKTNNALVENNDFDHTGHSEDAEPRLAGRGSGMWVWSCSNILAQFNRSYSVRGPNDSHGMHIDFGNKNIFYQYNYSEDSAGGFVEILGDNINSVYRFNVSVNDGVRDHHGRTLWVSDFAGTGKKIASDKNYIYNNTIYLDNGLTPDLTFVGKNIYVYNNIFQVVNGKMGEELKIQIDVGSDLYISNNLYDGAINNDFTTLDTNPYFGNPLFENPGVLDREAYKIKEGSPTIDNGLSFPEPSFPNAGIGIFKDIPMTLNEDAFGEAVAINAVPNIGASNVFNSNKIDTDSDGVYDEFDACPNTPLGFQVNSNGCTALSSANFTIVTNSETCPDQNNGTLKITAATEHNYTIAFNGKDHTFSDVIEITSLTPGFYEFCIGIVEDENFEQCFSIEIKQSDAIQAKLSQTSNKTTVEIIAGTAPYTVLKNGTEFLKTSNRYFEIDTKYNDIIQIKSSAVCEGVFTERISGFFTLTSNPVKDNLFLKFNNSVQQGGFTVHDMVGKSVYVNTFQALNGTAEIELPKRIKNGMYFLRVHQGQQTQTSKFILVR